MAELESLAARLQMLEDIEAIKQLKHRYFQACDNKQPEVFKECFTADEVIIEYGRIGSYRHRDQITRVFSELACHKHIIEMHHAHNPVIEILSSSRATGTWSLYYFMINTRDRNTVQFGGVYDDEYHKTERGWQMYRSEFRQTSTQLVDYNQEMVKMIFAGRTAPADIDNPESQK